MPELKVGDVLSGRVIRLEADGRLLIDLGDFQAKARADFPVQAGETLRLKVMTTGVPVYLKAVFPEDQETARSLVRFALDEVLDPKDRRHLLELAERLIGRQGSSGPVELPSRVVQALSVIQSRIAPLNLNLPAEQIAQQLKATIEESGLFLEKKLADAINQEAVLPKPENRVASDSQMKAILPEQSASRASEILVRDMRAQLLVLKDFCVTRTTGDEAHPVSAKEVEFLRTAVDKLLMHVEEQQGRMIQGSNERDPFQVVTHWLYMEEQSRPVRLKLYYPKARRGQEEQHQRIALLLDMDRIGTVRVDLAMVADHLRIDFYVARDDLRRQIEDQGGDISNALVGLFEQVHVCAHLSPEKITDFDREDNRAAGTGIVDVRV